MTAYTLWLVPLPIGVRNVRRRFTAVHKTTDELKRDGQATGGAVVAEAANWAGGAVVEQAARLISGARLYNLIVTNVPGPSIPLYLAGSRLLEAYPAVPLNPGNQRLTVGILSYDGSVFFGLLGDRDLDPPIEVARGALEAAVAELLA